jgi:hypothetical protein
VGIFTRYGTMWARNESNIARIPKSSEKNGRGLYILFDGSMPVYIGKGKIQERIYKARQSKRRGPFWDRFSWYAVKDQRMLHDLEVLILRMLPPYLRALTRQGGNFKGAKTIREHKKDRTAEYISRKVSHRKKK